MAFDYKKEYKEFYLPSRKPHLITVPPMNFVTVQGKGDPNDPAGEYQAAMEVLYGLAYTIKMSYKGSHRMEGFFEYVVPPLEGLWHQQGVDGVDYAHKETFEWTSMIRLPEFVTREEFDWAVQEATAKKKQDFSTLKNIFSIFLQQFYPNRFSAKSLTSAEVILTTGKTHRKDFSSKIFLAS